MVFFLRNDCRHPETGLVYFIFMRGIEETGTLLADIPHRITNQVPICIDFPRYSGFLSGIDVYLPLQHDRFTTAWTRDIVVSLITFFKNIIDIRKVFYLWRGYPEYLFLVREG